MASNLRPTGVLVPLVTPFDKEGNVELGVLEALANDVLDNGARGVVALATTGEPTALSAEERDAVVAACAQVCAERHAMLVIGAGTNDTRTTIERHEALADVPHADASLAVVPYYVRPTEAAIVRHFRAVAERSPVPVLIYNIPYRTGQGLGAESLLQLAATDNIAGVKQAVGGIDVDTLALLAGARERFAVLGGDDPFLLPLVFMGGAGAVAASSHLCTRRFVEMVECGLNGDTEEGRRHAEALLPVIRALFAEPSPCVIKAALHAVGRIPTPNVRMPHANASEAATQQAVQAIARASGSRS
jgi:4-hydroxy-tetrahydrodipicolinate synthase